MVSLDLIDWQSSTHDERKILYGHTRDLKRRENIGWHSIFEAAFSVAVGADYENNFRKGKIAGERALELFNWIGKTDPATLDRIENDIIALREKADEVAPVSSEWDDLLRDQAHFEDIRVYHHRQLGIVGFAGQEPLIDLKLRLGDEFYFQVDCPGSGALAAFQRYKNKWHLLPIGRSGNWIEVEQGAVFVPERDEDGKIDALSENVDQGKHQFVFIWSRDLENFQAIANLQYPRSIAPECLNQFAKLLRPLPELECRLCRCNMMIGQSSA